MLITYKAMGNCTEDFRNFTDYEYPIVNALGQDLYNGLLDAHLEEIEANSYENSDATCYNESLVALRSDCSEVIDRLKTIMVYLETTSRVNRNNVRDEIMNLVDLIESSEGY